MTRWTVDAPMSLDFDDVTALNVRLIAGTVAVLASDDRPRWWSASCPGGRSRSATRTAC